MSSSKYITFALGFFKNLYFDKLGKLLQILLEKLVQKGAFMTVREVLRKINNRYVYTTLIFVVVILFIDQFNLFEQIRLRRALKDQKQQIEYYEKEISKNKEYLDALQNDTATMEKVAREQYLMKRDNEVIYLIETQE